MIRVTKHKDHEHTVKIIKEEIMGLKIDDSETENIAEAFGWNQENMEKITRTFEAFDKFQQATQNLNPELPEATKISCLVDFLKSDSFKKLGMKIETPNDYLLLGFLWNKVNMLGELPEEIGNLTSLLKVFKELSNR